MCVSVEAVDMFDEKVSEDGDKGRCWSYVRSLQSPPIDAQQTNGQQNLKE